MESVVMTDFITIVSGVYMRNSLVLFVALNFVAGTLLHSQTGSDTFIRGGDLSFVPQIESLGGKYRVNGIEKDVLDIMQENGMNYVRLRIWHTPTGGWCGLDQTAAYAVRVKAKGLKFLLDFHYSDWWADPGQQNKPAAWANASYAALKESVYSYTKFVISTLKQHNALPDMVQIGNEITPGMLWPDGRNNTSLGWYQLGELVKEGIRGAKDAALDSTMKIMIHIDRGGNNNDCRWFFDNLLAQGVQFDIIGLSYYPWWHGTPSQMQNNINDLAVRYNKQIVIAETAYPWTTQSLNDGHGNIGVDPVKLPKGYSISPQGQKAFLANITNIIKGTTNGKGIGYFYWEPAYISVAPIGSAWEHLTVFDFSGSALSSVNAFLDLDSLKKINVTIRVNTATLWDTITTTGIVQVRGEIIGKGSSLLPSGDLVTWDSYSQVAPQNIGGDYWQYSFKMYESDKLEYKFWTGHTISIPTKLRLGYEGPVLPSDGANRNIRLITAGKNDTLIDLQYFNSSGYSQPQFWSPLQKKQDTIGIYFRVNLADLMKNAQFDPAVNGPVVLRGDSASTQGVLSWNSNTVVLQRETLSVAGGSFWSGAVYFPKNTIPVGTEIKYKFFIANSSFGGWESGINERTVLFPASDTTLMWKFFNERNPITAVVTRSEQAPKQFHLFQNFPNPFNPSTLIRYTIGNSVDVQIDIVNLLGQPIRNLVHRLHTAGEYSVAWNGTDNIGRRVNSGIYFVKLTAGDFQQIRKMIMLK